MLSVAHCRGLLPALMTPLLTVLPAGPLSAAPNDVDLRLGTGGIGVEYARAVHPHLDLRGGGYFGSYSRSYTEDENDYDGTLNLDAVALMLDYKPFDNGFHLSTGLRSAAPSFDLSAGGDHYQAEYEGRNYTVDGRVAGGIDMGGAAPYLGVGWGGNAAGTGFGVSFDVGVLFTASPDVNLAASGRACDSTLAACDPNGPESFDLNDPNDPRAQEFQQQLDQEVSNIEASAEDYKFWPMLSLGVHYRF